MNEFEPNHDGTERATELIESQGGLPEDNPFTEIVRAMRENGDSWNDVYDKLNEVFNVVDDAALEEKWEIVPDWRVVAVVPDQQATSGERYEEYERTAETAEEAERMIERKTGSRVDSAKTEQVGYSKVA